MISDESLIALTKLQLKRHEGLSLKPYRCPKKKLTIGYGRNLEATGIRLSEANLLLTNDIMEILNLCYNKFDWFKTLNKARKAVVVNMIYNIGWSGFLKFDKTLARLSRGDFKNASSEMSNSLWATQVPARHDELALQLLSGEF